MKEYKNSPCYIEKNEIINLFSFLCAEYKIIKSILNTFLLNFILIIINF